LLRTKEVHKYKKSSRIGPKVEHRVEGRIELARVKGRSWSKVELSWLWTKDRVELGPNQKSDQFDLVKFEQIQIVSVLNRFKSGRTI